MSRLRVTTGLFRRSFFAGVRVQKGNDLPALLLWQVGPRRHARTQLARSDKPEQLSGFRFAHRGCVQRRSRSHALQVVSVTLRAILCVELFARSRGGCIARIGIFVGSRRRRRPAKSRLLCCYRDDGQSDEQKETERPRQRPSPASQRFASLAYSTGRQELCLASRIPHVPVVTALLVLAGIFRPLADCCALIRRNPRAAMQKRVL